MSHGAGPRTLKQRSVQSSNASVSPGALGSTGAAAGAAGAACANAGVAPKAAARRPMVRPRVENAWQGKNITLVLVRIGWPLRFSAAEEAPHRIASRLGLFQRRETFGEAFQRERQRHRR